MNKRLTNEELTAIRERVEKATEGPWRIGKQSPNGLNNIGTMGGLLTAQTTNENDAVFIAHAREDIPKLLAEIERLREAISWGVSCGECTNQLAEDWEIINGRFVCIECRELYIPIKYDGGDSE